MDHHRRRNTLLAYTRVKRRRWRRRRESRTLRGMRSCRTCWDGAVVKCPVCTHVHCDGDCRPIYCIEQEQRNEQQEHRLE